MALAAGFAWRSRVALAKGWTMALYGVGVLFFAAWSVWRGVTPEPATMAIVGLLALTVNVCVAVLLYAFRDGDANMKSVWLCSRNDAIGNVAVMLAAAGVFGTGTLWPDIGVAVVLGALGLSTGRSVIVQAQGELNAGRQAEGRAHPAFPGLAEDWFGANPGRASTLPASQQPPLEQGARNASALHRSS
jgi:Co/Zn/Cd efflux system component